MPTLSSTNPCELKVTQMSPINRKSETVTATSTQTQTIPRQYRRPSSSPQNTPVQQSSPSILNGELPSPPSTPPQIHPATSAANAKPTVPQKRSAVDFRFGKQIGEGSFSTVYLAEDIHTRKEYASKCLKKIYL